MQVAIRDEDESDSEDELEMQDRENTTPNAPLQAQLPNGCVKASQQQQQQQIIVVQANCNGAPTVHHSEFQPATGSVETSVEMKTSVSANGEHVKVSILPNSHSTMDVDADCPAIINQESAEKSSYTAAENPPDGHGVLALQDGTAPAPKSTEGSVSGHPVAERGNSSSSAQQVLNGRVVDASEQVPNGNTAKAQRKGGSQPTKAPRPKRVFREGTALSAGMRLVCYCRKHSQLLGPSARRAAMSVTTGRQLREPRSPQSFRSPRSRQKSDTGHEQKAAVTTHENGDYD